MKIVIFAALIALSAASPAHILAPERVGAAPNLTEIARLYMNFGAVEGNSSAYDCNAWAHLWNSDGIRNTPGMPPTQGWDKLAYMCEMVRSQFTLLFCDSDLQINVVSYNAEKRAAFRWTINGVLATTGAVVNIPVITTLFMNASGTIQNAWDFLDPSQLEQQQHNVQSGSNVRGNFDYNEVVRVYMNFGGFESYPHAANCSQWATQFGYSGVRNTPGTPPVRGYDNLLGTCNTVRGQFETMLNYASTTINVTSWNAEVRVAFVWDIEGMLVSGKIVHVPAITALFMYRNGTIQNAWDFLDPTEIEP